MSQYQQYSEQPQFPYPINISQFATYNAIFKVSELNLRQQKISPEQARSIAANSGILALLQAFPANDWSTSYDVYIQTFQNTLEKVGVVRDALEFDAVTNARVVKRRHFSTNPSSDRLDETRPHEIHEEAHKLARSFLGLPSDVTEQTLMNDSQGEGEWGVPNEKQDLRDRFVRYREAFLTEYHIFDVAKDFADNPFPLKKPEPDPEPAEPEPEKARRKFLGIF